MRFRSTRTLQRSATVVIAVLALVFSSASSARAESWTPIYALGQVSIAACKVPVQSAYGPIWLVKVLYDRHSAAYPTATLSFWRNGTRVQLTSSTSWWNGRLSILESYASAWYDDRFSAYIHLGGQSSGGYGPSYVSMSSIGYC